MVLQVITPVVKGTQERAPEKKDNFLDILLKGLKAAESATGIGVNVEKLRSMSQAREEEAARIKGEKDIEAGIASPEARRAHIMSGGTVIEATDGGTITEELRRRELEKEGKKEEPEKMTFEKLTLGVEQAKTPEEKKKQQKILDEYIAAVQENNLTDEDFKNAEIEYGKDGIAYAVIKPLEPLTPVKAREEDLLDPTTGELIVKGGPERQKVLDARARAETRARDFARPLFVPIGWKPDKDPDDPRQFLKDTDVLLRDGNKAVVLRDFAPRILLKQQMAQADKKHGLKEGTIYKIVTDALDKKESKLQSVSAQHKAIREKALDAYKDYRNVVTMPNTGVGHVALVFKTIRNLDDKTGVKQGDMALLFRGVKGELPFDLSPDQITFLNIIRNDLQNKYGITEKDLQGIKFDDRDAEKKLQALILQKMSEGEKQTGFLSAQTVKDLRELNRTLYQSTREEYRSVIEPELRSVKDEFHLRLRGATNDEEVIKLVVDKYTPSLNKVPGIVEDQELDEFENEYPPRVAQKTIQGAVDSLKDNTGKNVTEDEQELLNVYREKKKRDEAKARGTGKTRGQQEIENYKQWRLEQKEMGFLK